MTDHAFILLSSMMALANTAGLVYVAYMTKRTEKNTNSLVTRLVKKTEDASHAKGVSDEKARAGGQNT